MDEERTSRSRRLLGDEGVERLAQARVAVIGLGGVGAACAEALVRAGVGGFLFMDKDVVSESDLNRQVIAFTSTIGMRKVDVMEAMARQINPQAAVEKLHGFVTEEFIDDLLDGEKPIDFIVDAVDTLTAKAAIARFAAERNIPAVSSMGMANRSDPTKLRFARLMDTQGCPFCREMRKICRSRGVVDMEVLYSQEPPVKVKPAPGAARAAKTELGTHSYMPPVAGLMLSAYVIQHLIQDR